MAFLPGSAIGVMGSGQLGRMLALAAQRMGYRVLVFSPQLGTPAGQVANGEVSAAYEDEAALARFADSVDVVTVEFENIPVRALELIEGRVPVRPGPEVLFRTQHRGREKEFLARHGLPHARTAGVATAEQYDRELAKTGTPAVLKTAGFGYDGKGQLLVRGGDERDAALSHLAEGPAVLEEFVEFEREISVIVARSPSGELRCCGPVENRHERHVLDVSFAPSGLPSTVIARARELAADVALALDLVGLACVEMFHGPGDRLLVNEIAPRPHNSGHLTIEACLASQFEQQLRAICDLPLAAMEFSRPAAMANLLGDLWQSGEPDWRALLARPAVSLHLYGKEQPRPGRKMGHLTAVDGSASAAVARVIGAREALVPSGEKRLGPQ